MEERTGSEGSFSGPLKTSVGVLEEVNRDCKVWGCDDLGCWRCCWMREVEGTLNDRRETLRIYC